jgi:Uma2 family endonuclease
MTPQATADPAVPVFPTNLPSEDGTPMDSPWHRAQMELLINCTEHRWRGRRDFYCGGNMFIHFSEEHVRNRDFRGPDFFVVLDTDHDRPRQYWAVWEEGGRYPDVIIELLSPTTAAEDRTVKRTIYERRFRTPEYFLYDPDGRLLEGLRLETRYRPIEPAADGRMWSHTLDCWLGLWDGWWDGIEGTWLRMFDQDGNLIPTGEEYEAARSRALAARVQAEATRARSEAARAQAEAARADAEAAARAAAEAELARLRAELAALKQPPPSP